MAIAGIVAAAMSVHTTRALTARITPARTIAARGIIITADSGFDLDRIANRPDMSGLFFIQQPLLRAAS